MTNVANGWTGFSILFIHIKMGIRKTPVIKVSMNISRESPEKLVKAANIIFV